LENPLPAIEHARKLGINVIVMAPLGDGILGAPIEKLSNLIPGVRNQVKLAFRYLLSARMAHCRYKRTRIPPRDNPRIKGDLAERKSTGKPTWNERRTMTLSSP
jgi:hypothetical protein